MMKNAALGVGSVMLVLGCESVPPLTPPPPLPPPLPSSETSVTKAEPALKFDAVTRVELNRLAAELNLPLFWIADKNASGAVDVDEVVTLRGMAPPIAWTQDGAFTPAFHAAYEAMVKAKTKPGVTANVSETEKRRRNAVLLELSQGQPSLLLSDFRKASAEDRALVGHLLKVSDIIDRIYMRQQGAFGLADQIAADDPASRTMFWRNHGPWCEQPKTEKNPDCHALANKASKISGLYPVSLQKDTKFCEALEARKDQKTLMNPFSVVVEDGGDLKAVPYNVAYKADMEAISQELAAAAGAITSADESAFKAYLTAASQAFLKNEWEPADEAWAKMNAQNSKWYLRVAPDETYFEPCSRKAGFHVSFAKINQASLKWQKMLEPHKTDLEAAVAKLAGAPYKARKVAFHLPDFIDIILNAGDSRSATGGTAGQSLPNWGPVANEGRGRTVAMINLFQDEDSRSSKKQGVESLFCRSSLNPDALDPDVATMGTVLHEAAHNLGPAHEYKVRGKTDDEIFGGPLAATFEELKAQTAALYFARWLADKGVIDSKAAKMSETRDIIWALNHIAQGMTTPDGKPKTYSQLASIQIGTLMDAGAIRWNAEETAANGQDKGCFVMDMDKVDSTIEGLFKTVLGIKARGDKAAAQKLVDVLVHQDGPWKSLRSVIEERMLRNPAGSLVYAVEL